MYVIVSVNLLARFFIYAINYGQTLLKDSRYTATEYVYKRFTARKKLGTPAIGPMRGRRLYVFLN